MQLPKSFVNTLGMRDLVRLDLETDHIGVWPTTAEQAERNAEEGLS
jgi:hypothetical protein